ncbi:Peptidase E [Acaryochloris thomasi RCC1774]|uniref:Peptidase E n=1 Tax=Acaryochloris thomasi RCC1774 TaxID=1764569 RepID=A0A2W1J9X8_9CYAN|nr:peptidase E [Acaryochloris thomasi]PZD70828.1 Peptidase E [Acaryochloris thomasi RCC1774]
MIQGQIIAIGGGGFSEGSEPRLDTYILEQCPTSKPKIGFLGTASGDAESYRQKFYARFSQLNCLPAHLTFFRRTPDLADWVMQQDAIYVGGGNTLSLLAIWEAWNLPPLLKEAARNGTILAGVSAGAVCWFESALTDARAGTLMPLKCLNFISGSCCPHYSLEAERKPTFEKLVRNGDISPGIAIDDGAAAHFVDGQLKHVISGHDGSAAYKVIQSPNGAMTEPLKVNS